MNAGMFRETQGQRSLCSLFRLLEKKMLRAFFSSLRFTEPCHFVAIRVRGLITRPRCVPKPKGLDSHLGGDTGTRTLDPLLAKQVL